MRSIYSRLMAYLLLGTTLLLLVAGVFFDSAIRVQLEREFDHALLAKAKTLVTLTTQENGEIELDFADEFMPEFEARENPEYFQLWLADGTLIERSRSLGSHDLSRTNPPLNEPVFSEYRLLDGRAGRLVEVVFIPHVKDQHEEEKPVSETVLNHHSSALPATTAVLSVARGRQDLDALIISIRYALVGIVLLLLGPLAVLVHVSIKQGLQPLNAIARQMQGLDANSLNVRVTITPASAELAPIVAQLNSLLARIDNAFEREKRFSENVAHELRTPLAEMRTLAETGARWPTDTESTRQYFQDVIDISQEMANIVSNLLTLARYDSGKQQINSSEFNLDELISAVWARLAKQAERKNIRLHHANTAALYVATDQANLEMILSNLLTNAITYSPCHETINMTTRCEANTMQIVISNLAPDFGREDLATLFDRFWRKDAARTGGDHAGLGMAIVKTLANHLALGLSCELTMDSRFRVVLSGLAAVEETPTPRSSVVVTTLNSVPEDTPENTAAK